MEKIILFESGSYCPDDYVLEEDDLNNVMESIKAIFEPSVFVGTVYDLIITQTGARLHFTLLHHDGRHEMELRRLSDYGYNNRHNASFDYFNEATVKFIQHNTRNFGKISDEHKGV